MPYQWPPQPQPQSQPRRVVSRRPLLIGALAVGLLAMIGLGVGIGYATWGGTSGPVASGHSFAAPFGRGGPAATAGRGTAGRGTAGRGTARGPATTFGGPRSTGGVPGTGRTGSTATTSANRGIIGVTVTPTGSTGAHVRSVIAGSPAAKAGLEKGDVITAVGSDTVNGPKTLVGDLSGDSPGQTVKISWTTSGGTKKSATITLESAAQG